MLIVECGQMRFMVFYNLYFLHCPYISHGYRTIHLFPFFRKSSCRNACSYDHFLNPLLRIWYLHGRLTNCLSPSSSLQDISRCTYPRSAGCFADMDFEPFSAFRLFRCATLPQGYFRIVVNLPVFTCPVCPQCLKRPVVHALNLHRLPYQQQTLTRHVYRI